MNWDDTGFLLSKNRYNENSLISEFYTKNHGKISGIVFWWYFKKNKKLSSNWKSTISKL